MTEKEPGASRPTAETEISPEVERQLGRFREDLEDGVLEVEAVGSPVLFEMSPNYEGLEGHGDRIMEMLKELVGFDQSTAEVAREYTFDGQPGRAGEGEVRVTVFKTDNEGVFVGRYEYADGEVRWMLRPEELPEFFAE